MSGECVFCGESITVRARHVVPPQLNDGSESAVDLCPTCHEKAHKYIVDPLCDSLGYEPTGDDTDDELVEIADDALERARLRKARRELEALEARCDGRMPKSAAIEQVGEATLQVLKLTGAVYEPDRETISVV